MERSVKDPLIGSTLDDRFLLLEGIGQGATSSVYKAKELSTDNYVAIKVLHAHLCTNENLVTRFQREAQAAQILVHPNIVAVKEYSVTTNGTPYLVMEFVGGISLQQKLTKDGWLPVSTALPIFQQICAALNVAHQAGIIHRDLKPGNIMLLAQSDGTYLVKILDFGCALLVPLLGDTVLKVTQTGEMLGSLLYMSPEQCLDQDVDARSDCYALACVLYETLTGKPPLSARTAFETMNKQLSVMPDSLSHVRPDLHFPKDLETVIFKAMAKSPAKRYQNVVEFMDALTKPFDPRSGVGLSTKSTANRIMQVARQASNGSSKPMMLLRKYGYVIFAGLVLFSVANINAEMMPFFYFALITFGVLLHLHKITWANTPSLLKILGMFVFLIMIPLLSMKAPALLMLIAALLSASAIQTMTQKQPALLEDLNERVTLPYDLALKLGSLPPLCKLEIIVVGARNSFTYSSGDKLISLDVLLAIHSIKQEIIVRPVFKSFFWDTICEEFAKSVKSGEVFAVPAHITKSSDTNWNVVVINSNQATIVEVVDVNRISTDGENKARELNFGSLDPIDSLDADGNA